jgi:uncharacterized coiled-coil DUF342 family protein
VNAFNRFKAEYDEMKKRAEFAEAKAVDFDRRVDAVKMERDSTVRSYRQFLKLNKMLESYDILKKPLDLSEEVANDSGKQ